MENKETKSRKTLKGTVVSNKMKDTVAVLVERYVKHLKYKKYFKKSKKYLAHDEGNKYNVGDVVEIESSRPISKKKSFKVTKLVKAKESFDSAQDKEVK